MGIMSKWEAGSRWLWNKYGNKIAPSAKKIRAWEFSPAVNKKLEELSSLLPASVRNMLLKLVDKMYKDTLEKYGKDYTKQLLQKVIDFVTTVMKGLGK